MTQKTNQRVTLRTISTPIRKAPATAVAEARADLPTYVIRGVDRTGRRRYYTGRPHANGDDASWLTEDVDGALPFQSKMGAQAKAKEFNDKHDGDLWFIVMQLPSTAREETAAQQKDDYDAETYRQRIEDKDLG